MSYEIVHAIGSTIYFVFFVLFAWMSRVPRTNPGAGWWAMAMLFASLSRLAFFLQALPDERELMITVYSALSVCEELLLIIGLVRFFDLPMRLHGFFAATLAIELCLLAVWASWLPPLLRSAGLAIFSAVFLAFAATITYRNRHALHPRLMLMASVSSTLLALHLLTASAIMQVVPGWFTGGFVLGMVLALTQYFLLLAALLLSFQKRLLAAESRALDMAFEDPLTGLSNKRYMVTLFDKLVALATRSQQLVAVFYIDLDNFKPINDQAGHAAGDEALKTVARRLRQSTRGADICARIGGDEFVVICAQLEQLAQVHEIAQKLLGAITSAITIKDRDYVLGASIGVSLYPEHGNSLAELLEHADRAMYQIKQSGKNSYRLHG